MKKWFKSHWFALAIFTASFALRLYAYDQTSFANGWDGYFYLVQIKSFIEEGEMHSSRLSLFYPLLITVQWFTADYELTYKIVSALIVGAFSLAFYNLSRVLCHDKSVASILGAFTLISPHLSYFGAQYVKNLMGVVVLLLQIIYVLKRRYVISILLVAASLFIHKMTAGLSLIFVGLILSNRYVLTSLRAKVIVTVIGILACVITSIFFGSELENRGLSLSSNWHWPTYTFIQSFDELLNKLWLSELLMVNLIYLGVILYLLVNRFFDSRWTTLVVIVTLLTLPFLEWSVLGLSFRFFMVFILLGPLLINAIRIKISSKYAGIIVFIMIVTSLFSIQLYSPRKFDPPYLLYKSLSDKIKERERSKTHDFELIIAHKSLAEYITFKTGIDVLPWQPEYHVANKKLWRIATGINSRTIAYFTRSNLFKKKVDFLSTNYFLIREDHWQHVIANVKQEDEDLYLELVTWKNPHEIRPNYLLKTK